MYVRVRARHAVVTHEPGMFRTLETGFTIRVVHAGVHSNLPCGKALLTASNSVFSGCRPTNRSISLPSLNITMVGMLEISRRPAGFGFLSTFKLATIASPDIFFARQSIMGSWRRQGAHQGVLKSIKATPVDMHFSKSSSVCMSSVIAVAAPIFRYLGKRYIKYRAIVPLSCVFIKQTVIKKIVK
jgi:hypothetical protein